MTEGRKRQREEEQHSHRNVKDSLGTNAIKPVQMNLLGVALLQAAIRTGGLPQTGPEAETTPPWIGAVQHLK